MDESNITTYGKSRFEVQDNGHRVAVFDHYKDAKLFVTAAALTEALAAVLTEQEHGQPDRVISPELETEARAALRQYREVSDV